jgi:predicted phosphoribosyltransferase
MFYDRLEAGKKLAASLEKYNADETIVFALPRGGAVLGAEVAKSFGVPLELILVRKIVDPENPEYALGAVTESGEAIYPQGMQRESWSKWLKEAETNAHQAIDYRKRLYYGTDKVVHEVRGNTVIIVDDGMATGLSMKAAITAIKKYKPGFIIVAVPVASQSAFSEVEPLVDDLIVLEKPKDFLGFVGAHYVHFDQVTDEEVHTILQEAEYVVQR